MGTEQTTDRGIAALVGRMADGFGKLVSQHIQLARAELGEDIRAMGVDVARIAVFVPFVLVGYLFVCGAVSALLAQWLGWAGALALVGGANLAGGGYGIFRAVGRLRGIGVMADTAQELTRSVSAALTTLQGPAPTPSTEQPAATTNTGVGANTLAQAPRAPASAHNVVLQQAAPGKNTVKEQPHGR